LLSWKQQLRRGAAAVPAARVKPMRIFGYAESSARLLLPHAAPYRPSRLAVSGGGEAQKTPEFRCLFDVHQSQCDSAHET